MWSWCLPGIWALWRPGMYMDTVLSFFFRTQLHNCSLILFIWKYLNFLSFWSIVFAEYRILGRKFFFLPGFWIFQLVAGLHDLWKVVLNVYCGSLLDESFSLDLCLIWGLSLLFNTFCVLHLLCVNLFNSLFHEVCWAFWILDSFSSNVD